MNVTSAPGRYTAIQQTFVNASSIGANTLVNAATINGGLGATSVIRILSMALISTAANTVKVQSAANDISSSWDFGVNGGMVLPFTEHGWFEGNPGESININLTAATKVAVHVKFIVLP